MDFYRYTLSPLLPARAHPSTPLSTHFHSFVRHDVRTARRPRRQDSRASRLLTDAVEQAHQPYDGVVGARRRDRSRVRDGHGAAQRVRHAVEGLDRQHPNGVCYVRVEKQPDRGGEQHQRHAVFVPDLVDYPSGTKEYRHFAAERLHSLRQPFQRFDPPQFVALVLGRDVFHVPAAGHQNGYAKTVSPVLRAGNRDKPEPGGGTGLALVRFRIG